jgi:hypothetical protein
MALRIEAIASYCGLKGIFKLRAADIYQVLSIEAKSEELGISSPPDGRPHRMGTPDPIFTMQALQDLAGRIQRADCLEGLVDSILAGLEDSFGFKYSMILVPAEEPGTLVTIATRGYAQNGAGAEMHYGEGIGGMVAEARKPIRISGLLRGMLYAYAMHQDAQDPAAASKRRRIPVPGLENPETLLGVPLLVRDDLVGVLCLESEVPYRFHEEDKASIELLGNYLAIAIQNMQMRQQLAEGGDEEGDETPGVADGQRGSLDSSTAVVYYGADECIMVDGEYLIRSLPAKILWKLLTTYESTGRTEFTNRELRLDKSLNLPEFKDNLESRLILLRRRLEQKSPDIRLVPRARGRFALEVGCELSLSTRP